MISIKQRGVVKKKGGTIVQFIFEEVCKKENGVVMHF